MRWWLSLLVGVSVAWMPAAGQDAASLTRLWCGVLATGAASSTECHDFNAYWLVTPPTERAVLISQVLGLGANPLTSGWAQRAMGGQPPSMPIVGDPAERVQLLGGALASYAGHQPFKPWEHVNPPPRQGRANGANGATGLGRGLQRLTASADGMPLISTAVQLGNSLADGSVVGRNSLSEEPDMISASLPQEDWWSSGRSEGPSTINDGFPLDWQLRDSNVPSVVGQPNSGWPSSHPLTDPIPTAPMSTVATPEPSALVLGLLGLAGTLFYARRSVKSTESEKLSCSSS